jgi:hypothetical protein
MNEYINSLINEQYAWFQIIWTDYDSYGHWIFPSIFLWKRVMEYGTSYLPMLKSHHSPEDKSNQKNKNNRRPQPKPICFHRELSFESRGLHYCRTFFCTSGKQLRCPIRLQSKQPGPLFPVPCSSGQVSPMSYWFILLLPSKLVKKG